MCAKPCKTNHMFKMDMVYIIETNSIIMMNIKILIHFNSF